MILQLSWEEPETGKAFLDVPLSQNDVQDLIVYLKASCGVEYGISVPSVAIVKRKGAEKVSVQELADSVRYSTGEGIFQTDCQLFVDYGIERS